MKLNRLKSLIASVRRPAVWRWRSATARALSRPRSAAAHALVLEDSMAQRTSVRHERRCSRRPRLRARPSEGGGGSVAANCRGTEAAIGRDLCCQTQCPGGKATMNTRRDARRCRRERMSCVPRGAARVPEAEVGSHPQLRRGKVRVHQRLHRYESFMVCSRPGVFGLPTAVAFLGDGAPPSGGQETRWPS